jgi:peroxiredoxin
MLRNRAFQIAVMSVLFASVMIGFSVATAEDTPSTTKSTTTTTAASEPTKPAEIAPDAAPLLEKLSTAYKNLKSLDLTGTLGGDFDVDGEKRAEKVEINASFAAPNQFRHAIKDELLVGSTGDQLFVFEPRVKLYRTSDAKKDRVSLADMPAPFDQILLDQNLSLAMAMSNDPAGDLGKLYQKIAKAADITIDGKAHPALALTNDHETLTLALDPQTSLVRRASFDIAKVLKKRGAQDVAKAVLTMDYPTSTPGATTKPEQFAWVPPSGARDAATIQSGPGDIEVPAVAMSGKPAPDFTLKDINGKDVKLSDLKGSVIVFDFWATWCPPCVRAMPGLNELAGEFKDEGLKIVGINQDEDKDLVQGFINSRKLNNLIILLDPGTKISTQYMATEPLPTTMVIGKDGTVRKVLTTFGPEGERDLKAAVHEALQASK